MKYVSISQFAKKWDLSEKTVRNYCATGKTKGTFLTGKIWNIPEDANIPEKVKARNSVIIDNYFMFIGIDNLVSLKKQECSFFTKRNIPVS